MTGASYTVFVTNSNEHYFLGQTRFEKWENFCEPRRLMEGFNIVKCCACYLDIMFIVELFDGELSVFGNNDLNNQENSFCHLTRIFEWIGCSHPIIDIVCYEEYGSRCNNVLVLQSTH